MLKLKELRKATGITVKTLSNVSGISHRTIEDIERRGDCRISTAWILCKALQCSLDDFYNDEEK